MATSSNINESKIPPVWLYSIIKSLRGFLLHLYYRLTPAKMAVFEKSQGFWIAKSIGVACELNLADIIGDQTLSIETIADKANCKPQPLYRLLRTLAGEGIFKEKTKGNFTNTAFSRALLEGEAGMKHMIQHQTNQTNWAVVNEMKHCLQTGQNAATKVIGKEIFKHLEEDKEKNALYNKAMSNTSAATAAAILAAYNFSGIKILADIGGGRGHLLFHILRRYPNIKGIVFDREYVVQKSLDLAKTFGIEVRLETLAGDFFKEIPLEADACMLKNIVHAFNDEQSILLLKKINDILPQQGKVLLIENVIYSDNKPAFGKTLDLQMMIGTQDGKERTAAEFQSILEKSGFEMGRIVPTVSPFCIIEGIRV